MKKRAFQVLVVTVILAMTFTSVGTASAGTRCADYFTVRWGDTLSGIAAFCGTTMAAIQSANPGLGSWVYVGQVLRIPNGSAPAPQPQPNSTYVVQWGDTLAKIAARTGVSVWAILKANPQIGNMDLIYAGQVINLPVAAPPPPYPTPVPTQPPAPPPADYFSSLTIAYRPGLYIRTAPGGTIIASALNKSVWYYKQSSLTIDASGKVWAAVRLSPSIKGYTTGWLLVKDQLGKYFTDPPIDPPLDP